MPAKILPSVKYLCECFIYDPKMDQLIWKHRPRHHFIKTKEWMRWNSRYAGTVAGWITSKGYRAIRIDVSVYKMHRIVWKMLKKTEPPPNIDHIYGDKLDNTQLRSAPSQVEQARNTGLYGNNTSGYRGVQWHHTKWRAGIRIHGKWICLGRFDNVEDAAAAYEAAARKLFGEFYRHAADTSTQLPTDDASTK